MTRDLQKILFVDDERDILEVARLCLEVVGGFEVTTLDNGTAAVAQAQDIAPDLIMLDVMMPEMNGPDTLAALRRQPVLDNVPVIFITARVQPAEIDTYLKQGATAVIPKPFDPMSLSTEVRRIWENAHA